MEYLLRKLLRLLPLLVFALSLAVIVTHVKSAAEFPGPCRGVNSFANPIH